MATGRTLPPFMMKQNMAKSAAQRKGPFKPCTACKSPTKCRAAGKCLAKEK